MSANLRRKILGDFLENSKPCIQAIVDELRRFDADKRRDVRLLEVNGNHVKETVVDGNYYFLRASVEYANPQLTLEELQGVIAARLIEVCGNYFSLHGFHEISKDDMKELCGMLEKPAQGRIFPFLLNTDDVEPDRYSLNPLRASIVESGQSAFPSAFVSTSGLKLDEKFVEKYEGSLISKSEAELIEYCLASCGDSYVDMVDAVKHEYLKKCSEVFGIDLCLPVLRMPLRILGSENVDGLLHHIIREAHKNYESVEGIYNCMGRSMKKRTTLLTVPHSKEGFGSKKAARGKIYFEGTELKCVRVTFRTTPLYPNDVDSRDISVAKAEDEFTVDGEKLMNYDFRETPSSPQFILYSIASPENAAIWHGIGESGAEQLVKSFTSLHLACARDEIVRGLRKYGVVLGVPLQLNLVPEKMWVHPVHKTIDASVGSVENLEDLARSGMWVERLSSREYARRR